MLALDKAARRKDFEFVTKNTNLIGYIALSFSVVASCV